MSGELEEAAVAAALAEAAAAGGWVVSSGEAGGGEQPSVAEIAARVASMTPDGLHQLTAEQLLAQRHRFLPSALAHKQGHVACKELLLAAGM